MIIYFDNTLDFNQSFPIIQSIFRVLVLRNNSSMMGMAQGTLFCDFWLSKGRTQNKMSILEKSPKPLLYFHDNLQNAKGTFLRLRISDRIQSRRNAAISHASFAALET